VVETKDPSRP